MALLLVPSLAHPLAGGAYGTLGTGDTGAIVIALAATLPPSEDAKGIAIELAPPLIHIRAIQAIATRQSWCSPCHCSDCLLELAHHRPLLVLHSTSNS